MSDYIKREDAVKEIHKYFMEELDKQPYEIVEDGDEAYSDMKTINLLLACNKELREAINAIPIADVVEPPTIEVSE